MIKVLMFIGTRPEAIKMVPVLRSLRSYPEKFCALLCSTGQHKSMLDQALHDFDIISDYNLNVMTENQSIAGLSSRLFEGIDAILSKVNPDIVLVQGDTTTVKVASLCAFYRNIAVGHIEAGLRSHDIHSPFPEELNRKVTSLVATWHFAPTTTSRQNLINEGIDSDSIAVTGNTVIDSLRWMVNQINNVSRTDHLLPAAVENAINGKKDIICVTGHRRENFGSGFKNICTAILNISKKFPETVIVFPMHLNPNVRTVVETMISGFHNIILLDPLTYKSFVYLLYNSKIILTDSGGLQEEGLSLNKPVVVMRDVTERPEGVACGACKLVGTDVDRIISTVSKLLMDRCYYEASVTNKNPYGDGTAGDKIVNFINSKLRC